MIQAETVLAIESINDENFYVDSIKIDVDENIESDSPEETQMVMGFEFNYDDAEEIRHNDLAMKILTKLQEDGVAKFSIHSLEFLPNAMTDENYWNLYVNTDEHSCVFVVYEIPEVHE